MGYDRIARKRGKQYRGGFSHYGFHRYYASKSKISCIIIANLVTPRRDPHGYDKSRIDMQPFSQSNSRAAGYRFADESDYSTATWHSVQKDASVRKLLKDFLVKERGLPAI